MAGRRNAVVLPMRRVQQSGSEQSNHTTHQFQFWPARGDRCPTKHPTVYNHQLSRPIIYATHFKCGIWHMLLHQLSCIIQCMRLTLYICKKPTRRQRFSMWGIEDYGTYSCLIPALDSCEMGASTNRFEVKCFLSVVMTVDSGLVLWLEIGTLLRTGIGEG